MEIFKYGPLKAIFALFSALFLLPSALSAAPKQEEENIIFQNEHLNCLKTEYYTENYVPVNEAEFTAFDLQTALSGGIKLNEIAVIGTHNSYQIASREEYKKLYDALDVGTFGIVKGEKTSFNMDTFTEQLTLGIRSLEIDVIARENGQETHFTVCHDPLIDNTSTAFDFKKALEEIKLFSENNPNHIPITIIIEPKAVNLPINGITSFTAEKAFLLDSVLEEVFGDILLTPADVLGEYDSFKSMRENDAWPALSDTLGKVMVVLHPCNATDKYIKSDSSIKTQKMFPMVRFEDRNKDYTSFILDNDPDSVVKRKEIYDNLNVMVRTRADSFPNFSEKRYNYTNECTANIISTDYPVKMNPTASHCYSFDGFTVRLAK